MKTCTKCHIEKELSEFGKNKRIKSGIQSDCKVCMQISNWESVKKYKLNNPVKIKQWQIDNKEKHLESVKKYNSKNPDIIKARKKEFNKNNREKINKTRRIYRKKNKDVLNEKIRIYTNLKRKTDNLFKLKTNIRNSINISFRTKGVVKKSKTVEILGCSFEEFKLHLESQFQLWMNWQNHGKYNGQLNYGWDIDHIIPVSNAKTEGDIIKLSHYTNFQPLCSKVNRDIKKAN